MKPGSSLRWRIVKATLLSALAATLLLAVIAVIAVEGIEEHLVDNRLAEVATWASPRYAAGMPVAMPAGLSFHHGQSIPLSLRGLPAGTREVHVDGIGLHVLSGKDELGNYVVVDHESDYEKVELVVYSMFVLAFICILALSLALGRFIGRRFVTPITALADAVGAGAIDVPSLARQDELGVLARAFSAHTTQLHGFLERERFFTGDVSHELRTPLTVILGAGEILMAQGRGDPAIEGPAERIVRAANEAADCVNALLMLARSPELIARSPTDIGALAKLETERYQMLMANKDAVLRYASGTSFSMTLAPELCSAVVANLIRNACQYTWQGEVVVRLGPHAIIVEDSGPGMPQAVLDALDGNLPLASGSAGTGLGLALVKRLCDYLGATLTHAPRAGGGSIFTVTFQAI